jgi:hypothetical protein
MRELAVASRNITARRKLSDLYAKGVEVRFGPEGGRVGPFADDDGKPIPVADDEVAVWVQPPSPLEREMSMRDAQAARARALLRAKRDSESEEHLTALVFLAEMDFPTLVDYVLITDQESRRNEAVRDVLGRDEWKDITAYQDALRRFEEDETPEDDPEHAAMLELDVKYGDQVSERQTELTDAARQVLEMLGRERVEQQALEKRSEIVGSQAFMHEYELQMTFYAVRDVRDHSQLFFESVKEWADQDDEIRSTVNIALTQFIGEAGEAKNSPGAASGSEQSEPPSKQETSEASIPEAANA